MAAEEKKETIVVEFDYGSDDEPVMEGRCAMCLENYIKTFDVRMLDCSHIYCMKCLKDNQRSNRVTTCPECRKAYGVLDLEELHCVFRRKPYVYIDNGLCKSRRCNTEATWYCLDCFQDFCDTHKEMHDSLISDHKILTYPVYQVERHIIEPTICRRHREQHHLLACRVCFQLVCPYCLDILGNSCPYDDKGIHPYRSIGFAANELEERFNKEIKELREKIKQSTSDTKLTPSALTDSGDTADKLTPTEVVESIAELMKTIRKDNDCKIVDMAWPIINQLKNVETVL